LHLPSWLLGKSTLTLFFPLCFWQAATGDAFSHRHRGVCGKADRRLDEYNSCPCWEESELQSVTQENQVNFIYGSCVYESGELLRSRKTEEAFM
jgi:hypothetical protein